MHDIGKNIVSVVLACNNYEVIDLGVMVPCEKILAAAPGADVIGLSGLITPSLDEMARVAAEMERRGLTQPLLVGGATTSGAHTAVKIAPAYSGVVCHAVDASRVAGVLGSLLNRETRTRFVSELREKQRRARESHERQRRGQTLLTISEARARAFRTDWAAAEIAAPPFTGARVLREVTVSDLAPLIDWSPFFHAWELRGRYPQILTDATVGEQARELFADARELLGKITRENLLKPEGVYGFFPANSDGDDLRLFGADGELIHTALTLRQQMDKAEGANYALADFIAPLTAGRRDWLGAFAVTSGAAAASLSAEFERSGDDYSAILLKALADRLAEAFAEWLHRRVREEWGFGGTERSIRPAPGYPACPDHSEKVGLFRLLEVERQTCIRLTENMAMTPAGSVSGWYFAHPQAGYFGVGRVGQDQCEDYRRRKQAADGDSVDLDKWLNPLMV
ncbi:MAG: cobalamin-dependent protein [Verrucomicrobiales bacterium]|nr:cobalamin-dependent protein [Verrucomicrobiales bacterium]